MIKLEHINALGNILNETFGRGSIRDAGHAIHHTLETHEDKLALNIRFECFVNFNPREGIRNQKDSLDNQSIKALNEVLSNTKKEFKDITGDTLKVTNEYMSEGGDVEHISHNPSLVRARYYRNVLYWLSV